MIRRNLLSKIGVGENERNRTRWLCKVLSEIPAGLRILDAGAGELRNREYCAHLSYVSQDICEYEGKGNMRGLHTGKWDTSNIDIVCDICNIPEPAESFDVILCSEVLEHLPDPLRALQELYRLLKPGGVIIITAPFSSLVHFAPYHYCTGFSRYWYEHHLPLLGLDIKELTPNGNWFSALRQEILRLPFMAKKFGGPLWILMVVPALFGVLFLSASKSLSDSASVGCFGWHCIAIKR